MSSPSGHDQGHHKLITLDLWGKQAWPPGSNRAKAWATLISGGTIDTGTLEGREQLRDLVIHAGDLVTALHQITSVGG